jgi:hypothetical protein
MMADVSVSDAIGQLVAVLREAFEGAESWSYFTDHGPESGLLGTLAKVSAAEASEPRGGSSIAAHAYHVLFSLDASADWIRGDRTRKNWQESWRVRTVDEAGWVRMREQLREKYETLRRTIEAQGASGVEALGGAVGAVAHMAYHLGAIRQKVAGG